jgi:hypothetical protein
MLLSRQRPRPDQTRRPRPRLEPLEDRCLPAVQVLATLGDPAAGPGHAGFLINDFEPGGFTNNGTVAFGADLGTTSDPSSFIGEAIYLRDNQGKVTRLAGSTDAAPGGGTYGGDGFFGPVSLNNQGDVAFAFHLDPSMFPIGVNGGLFRYSHATNAVTPVVTPFVTPAPGTGAAFQGATFDYTLTDNGNLFFDGIVKTDKGIHLSTEPYTGLGEGIYLADKAGHVSSVLVPGDTAPGGGKFDYVLGPAVNASGDMAFEAHVAGEPATLPFFAPQSVFIDAINSVYLRDGATGKLTSVAHYGDPAPGTGGTFYGAYGAQINSTGDVIFIGNLTADYAIDGLFRYSKGATIPIAVPGQAMPGGGHLATVSGIFGSQQHINNKGDVLYNATLDTATGGVPDQGLYLWSKGTTTLIARSGTVLPGVGTIASLTAPASIIIGPSPGDFPTGGAYLNDSGQVLFSATLTDGRDVLLLLTPTGGAAAPRSGAPAAASPLAGVASFLVGDQKGPAAGQKPDVTVQDSPASSLTPVVTGLTQKSPPVSTPAASHAADREQALDALFSQAEAALGA